MQSESQLPVRSDAPSPVPTASPAAAPPVRYHAGPLRRTEIPLADLVAAHATGWKKWLAPTQAMIEQMIVDDSVFAGFADVAAGRTLVTALHARPLEPGSHVGALAVATCSGRVHLGAFPSPVTRERVWICHAAVAHRSFQGASVCQGLVVDCVVPYLLEHAPGAKLWTTSPDTSSVTAGRALVADDEEHARVHRHLEAAVRRFRPLDANDLDELVERARPWLEREDLVEPRRRRGSSARDFFQELYFRLPTHAELVRWRSGGPADQARAAACGARVDRLYAPPSGPDAPSHRAAFVLLYLAVSQAQWGVFAAATGKPFDDIQGFHSGNGARLHPTAGPIPDSRPVDVSAQRFGQIFCYDEDYLDRREQYRSAVAARVALGKKFGVIVDEAFFAEYLPRVTARITAYLAAVESGQRRVPI